MPELNVTEQEVLDALHSWVHIWCDLDNWCEKGHTGFTFPDDPKRVDALLQKVLDYTQGKTT